MGDNGQRTGTPGTGKYEGYTWDGRHWVGQDGQREEFGPWRRTHWAWRAVFVTLAAALAVYVAWQFR